MIGFFSFKQVPPRNTNPGRREVKSNSGSDPAAKRLEQGLYSCQVALSKSPAHQRVGPVAKFVLSSQELVALKGKPKGACSINGGSNMFDRGGSVSLACMCTSNHQPLLITVTGEFPLPYVFNIKDINCVARKGSSFPFNMFPLQSIELVCMAQGQNCGPRSKPKEAKSSIFSTLVFWFLAWASFFFSGSRISQISP